MIAAEEVDEMFDQERSEGREPPRRIQLSRKAGWRMPPGTVKVDRSTVWGNPWRVNEQGPGCFVPPDARSAVALFRRMLVDPAMRRMANYPDDLAPLEGRHLACWCRLGEPCHADVLLEHLARSARRGDGSRLHDASPDSRSAPGDDA